MGFPTITSVPCLLCGHQQGTIIDQLTGIQLRALYQAVGRSFSPEAWGNVTEQTIVSLRRCDECGFEFYDPRLAGGESFYQELDDPLYYTSFRPEFARTLEWSKNRRITRILDVGCGRGDFLTMAKASGYETFGLELNAVAASKARTAGHVIFTSLLNELTPRETQGGFDLITLFQVLEHVPNPPEIMKEAAKFLNPGGAISVAVPTLRGVCRLSPWDPAHWPPHHLSRWRIEDFKTLSRVSNLCLVETGGDTLFGSEIEFIWNNYNRLAPVLNKPQRPGGGHLPRALCFFYRKTSMKLFFPKWGRSVYAYFANR